MLLQTVALNRSTSASICFMSVARFFALVIPGFPKRAIRNPSQIPWKEEPGRLRHLRAASYIWKPFGTLLFLSRKRSIVVWFYFKLSRRATPLLPRRQLPAACGLGGRPQRVLADPRYLFRPSLTRPAPWHKANPIWQCSTPQVPAK